jgi:hypothetical protein
VWLCAWATADGESGSSTVVFLKTIESLGYENDLKNPFEINPCMSKFAKMNLILILVILYA